MMRRLGQFFSAGFGGTNLHFTVKLPTIRRKDFGIKVLGQLNGQSGFATSRWATDDQQEFTGRKIGQNWIKVWPKNGKN